MTIRMNDYELARMGDADEINEEKKHTLEAAAHEAEEAHRALTDELERTLNYEVVPIKKLVSIQLECGLLVRHYLKDKAPLGSCEAKL